MEMPSDDDQDDEDQDLKRCASNVSDTDLSNQCNSSSDLDTSHSD
jgi:hypothetical protein